MSSRSCARFDFCRISKFLQRKFRKNRKISKWKKKEISIFHFFFWFTPWPDNRTGFCRFVSLSQCFLCCCSLLCNPVLVPGLLPLFFRKNCLLSPPLNKPFLWGKKRTNTSQRYLFYLLKFQHSMRPNPINFRLWSRNLVSAHWHNLEEREQKKRTQKNE